MKKRILTLLLISSLYANQVVMLDGGEGLDPCSLSKVNGLDSRGDGFLAVRSGAGAGYTLLDKIYNGQEVWSCDVEGKWLGIVYGGKECTPPSSPLSDRQAYKGNCKTGWVYHKWILQIAG